MMFLKRIVLVIVLALCAAAPSFAQSGGTLAESDALLAQAQVIRNNGRSAEAEELLNRALEIRTRLLGQNDPRVAQIIDEIGKIYYNRRDFAKAETLFRRALTILETTEGSDSLDVGMVLGDVGASVREQRRYKEAEGIVLRSLQIRRQRLAPGHVAIGGSLDNLSRIYFAERRYDDAEATLSQALAIMRPALGPNHPQVRAEEALSLAIRDARLVEKSLPIALLLSIFGAAVYLASSLFLHMYSPLPSKPVATTLAFVSGTGLGLTLGVTLMHLVPWLAVRIAPDFIGPARRFGVVALLVGLWLSSICSQVLNNVVRRQFGERVRPIMWFRTQPKMWPEPVVSPRDDAPRGRKTKIHY